MMQRAGYPQWVPLMHMHVILQVGWYAQLDSAILEVPGALPVDTLLRVIPN